MRTKFLLSLALLATFGTLAWVRRNSTPDALATTTFRALLARPLDPGPKGASSAEPQAFWRALLELPAVVRTENTLTLPLGRVLSDPSAARLAAESAGELLALEAESQGGPLGLTLLQAILAGPAVEQTETGAVLKLYGCRHSADADAGPLLEDSYYARLSLAGALRAAAQQRGLALTLRGEDAPVKGGVNFEVQLSAEQQVIEVTFDGTQQPPLRARRSGRPRAPNDARARANLVQALEALAADAGLTLLLEGRTERAPGGIDLRLEHNGQRLSLIARSGAARLATHLDLASPSSLSE
ncbi:MAG: hypothetical protein EXS08_15425 [Planctomycetes bacterium]|nr:hypothetical protein [Planctomycetota bacterium]